MISGGREINRIKRNDHQVPKIVRVTGNKTNPNTIRIKIYE